MPDIKVLSVFNHTSKRGRSYRLTPDMQSTSHIPASIKKMAVNAGAAEYLPDPKAKKKPE